MTKNDILQRRHIIRRAVRAYLDGEDYIEIDAPLLVRGTTPDPAVESFAVGDRYLSTSTEYQMKRLAAGGMEKIYSLTQNFRAGDATGAFRNPEFTMLEFGRTGCGMEAIERDVKGLVTAAMVALGQKETLTYQGRLIDLHGDWDRIGVMDAVARITDTDFTTVDAETCRRALTALDIEIRADWENDADFLFSLVMEAIQPKLGWERPVFLRDWPLYQTTSAGAAADGLTADRSELFIAGIEIGDGFAALADADMQSYLFQAALARRAANGQSPVTLDEKYLDTMREATIFGAGMALGFDRLVMLLTDRTHINDVLAFSWDEL